MQLQESQIHQKSHYKIHQTPSQSFYIDIQFCAFSKPHNQEPTAQHKMQYNMESWPILCQHFTGLLCFQQATKASRTKHMHKKLSMK
jgi:hypothetical protein